MTNWLRYPNVRPTDDADLVVELRAGTYTEAATALEHVGYRRHEPLDLRAPLHRFTRPEGHVDLMAPDNTAVRFAGREVVRVHGARSALERTTTFQTPGGITIRIPDIASALSRFAPNCPWGAPPLPSFDSGHWVAFSVDLAASSPARVTPGDDVVARPR